MYRYLYQYTVWEQKDLTGALMIFCLPSFIKTSLQDPLKIKLLCKGVLFPKKLLKGGPKFGLSKGS